MFGAYFEFVGGARALRILTDKGRLLESTPYEKTLEGHLQKMRGRLGDDIHGGLTLMGDDTGGQLTVTRGSAGALTEHEG